MLCSCFVHEAVCCTVVLYSPLCLHSFLAETIYVRFFGFPQALDASPGDVKKNLCQHITDEAENQQSTVRFGKQATRSSIHL
jgi:hypothetical protein